MNNLKLFCLILSSLFSNKIYSVNKLVKLINRSGRDIYWQYKFESKSCCKDNSECDRSAMYVTKNSDTIIPINDGVKIREKYLPNKILIFKEEAPDIILEIDIRKETFIDNEEKKFIVLADEANNLYIQGHSSCCVIL